MSRKRETDHPDTVTSTSGSQCETAVVRPKETGPLQSSMNRSRRSAEGPSGLDVPHYNGHGDSQHPSALLDGTLDMVWVVYEGSNKPGS